MIFISRILLLPALEVAPSGVEIQKKDRRQKIGEWGRIGSGQDNAVFQKLNW